VVNHDCFDKATLKQMGTTSGGIPIGLDKEWVSSDIRITTGFVEPHLFAGFSGGPKLVAPGLAGLDTIMVLHGAKMLSHPRAIWGIIEGNPLHEAIREIAYKTGIHFTLDVTLNRDHQVTGVYAGKPEVSHPQACAAVKKSAMRPVAKPFDVILTTNSGYPLDLNLYQSIKGVSAAALVVRQGGVILCAAECWDGIPEHGEYRDILASRSSPEELLQMIHSPGYHRQDQWQVQVQAQIQMKAKVYLKTSYLTDEQVRAAHLEPVHDLEEAVARALRNMGAGATLCVLPEGPQTIPYVEEEAAVAAR
jgi:nickel-dependent lactate racemase